MSWSHFVKILERRLAEYDGSDSESDRAESIVAGGGPLFEEAELGLGEENGEEETGDDSSSADEELPAHALERRDRKRKRAMGKFHFHLFLSLY